MTRRLPAFAAAFAVVFSGYATAQNPPDPGRPPAPVATPPAPPPAPTPAQRLPLELYGASANAALASSAPADRLIATETEWVALARAWAIKNPPPVDFTKQVLVVVTSRSAKMSIEAKRDDDTGAMRVGVLEGDDFPSSGFRYGIKAIDRAGLKTINGKPLPPLPAAASVTPASPGVVVPTGSGASPAPAPPATTTPPSPPPATPAPVPPGTVPPRPLPPTPSPLPPLPVRP